MSGDIDANIRVQANDGSLHVFPAGTQPDVVANTLARYNAGTASAVPPLGAGAQSVSLTPRSASPSPALPSTGVPFPLSPTTQQLVAMYKLARATNQDNPNKQTPMSSSMNSYMRGRSNTSVANIPSANMAGPMQGPTTAGGGPWQIPGSDSVANRSHPPIPLIKPDDAPQPVFVPPAIRPSIGAVPGYSETGRSAWRGADDVAFQDAAYNYDVQNNRMPGDPGFMSPELLKAWAMQETGSSPKWFRKDPLTANNPLDWVKDKATAADLAYGQNMTPQASADAALKWLQHTLLLKGHVFYPGDYEALREYNARTDVQPDGNMFSQDYATNILNNYRQMMGNRGRGP